jgi:hypothetical protein
MPRLLFPWLGISKRADAEFMIGQSSSSPSSTPDLSDTLFRHPELAL